MNLELRHLAADVFGLDELARRLLSDARPLFGVRVPRSVEDLRPAGERLDRDERAALVQRLSEHVAPYAPHVHVLDSLRALAEPGTSLVVATAHADACGGRLASLWAALHAIAASRELTRAWGRPVPPLLWIDGDTVAPSEEAWFRSSDSLPVRVQLPHDADAEHVAAARACLRHLLHGAEQLDAALDLYLPRANEHVEETLARVMLELLGAHGLLVCRADWVRADVGHFLAQAIGHDPCALLASTRRALDDEGISDHEDACDEVLIRDAARRALHAGGDGFRYADEPGSRTCAELAAEIVQDPAGFRIGARLLPLVQDQVLPTALRIVSRESLATEVLLCDVRAALGVDVPPLAPRLSCTLVEAATRTSLEKLDLDVSRVLSAAAATEDEPPSEARRRAVADLRGLAERASVELTTLARELWSFDPKLRPVAKRAAGELREAVERLCSKAERVLDNRGGTHRRHQRVVRECLLPGGRPQESVEGPLAWHARHGTDWIDALVRELDPFAGEHQVVDFP